MSSIIDTLDLCRRTTCSYRPALCGNPAQRARLLKLHVTLERQVLRTGTPNSVDRALHQGLRLTLFASVHETAVDIHLGEAARSGQPLNPHRSGAQVARYLDQAWAEGLMQANNSDFFKVRAAGLVCLLEGMLMAFKARELPDSDERVKTELLAAAMTTAAAGFEIGASYVDQVVTRYGANSVTGRGAAAALGRLKLWGAGLAGVGGGMLAWWDIADAVEYFKSGLDGPSGQIRKKSKLLATSYFVRAAATITLSLAELGTAIAIAKPLFDHLSLNARTKHLKDASQIRRNARQTSRNASRPPNTCPLSSRCLLDRLSPNNLNLYT